MRSGQGVMGVPGGEPALIARFGARPGVVVFSADVLVYGVPRRVEWEVSEDELLEALASREDGRSVEGVFLGTWKEV